MFEEKRLLLEGKGYAHDTNVLRAIALNEGWDVLRIFNYSYEDDGAKPVLYGSMLLASILSEACNVTYVRSPNNWLSRLPQKYLKREVEYYAENVDWPSTAAFIKCCDIKWFVAKVYEPHEMPSLAELIDEDGIIISEPVNFSSEVRFFILNNEIMTASTYIKDNQPTYIEGIWRGFPELELKASDFVEELLNDKEVQCPQSLVIDIGHIDGLGWAVIEANESWYSGLYACDPYKALETIEGAVVKVD